MPLAYLFSSLLDFDQNDNLLLPTPEPTMRPDTSITDGVNSIVQILTLSFIFVLVITIAMLATRWIVKYQRGVAVAYSNAASRIGNIEVVETYRLTLDKYIQIVRVGEKYLAIGVGKNDVSVLTELHPDEISFVKEEAGTMPDFAGFLTKFKNTFGDKNKNDSSNRD